MSVHGFDGFACALRLKQQQDVVTTSLCKSQRRCSNVSNETPNDVSTECHQVVSVVRLRDILLERRDNVSRGRNNDVPSVRLLGVSSKSQIKHSTTLSGTSPRRLSGTYR